MPPVGETTEKTNEESRSKRRPFELIRIAGTSYPNLRPLGQRVIDAPPSFHIQTLCLLKDLSIALTGITKHTFHEPPATSYMRQDNCSDKPAAAALEAIPIKPLQPSRAEFEH
jgi:hypothetical protein